MKFIQVLTTTDDKKVAVKIADVLVKQRLAACVQISGPIHSTYRWKGKLQHSKEWICMIKTKKDLYKKVEAAVIKLHNYELPEIIAVPIDSGSESYLKWMKKTAL